MRTRLLGGVGAGRSILPATRFASLGGQCFSEYFDCTGISMLLRQFNGTLSTAPAMVGSAPMLQQ